MRTDCIENTETERVRQRYERRKHIMADLYNPLNPSVYMSTQERERALIKLIQWAKLEPVRDKHLLEIGCGSGGNLLQLIKLGFKPDNLVANELLEERAETARHHLPLSVKVIKGDAVEMDLEPETFDIVFQSTVFTSILDSSFQQRLAEKTWQLTKPGGGVIWYDFIYNNPANPDVIGIPPKRIRQLYPQGKIKCWRTTLAPPISRRVTKIHPSLYSLFNTVPLLRTHVLCWIEKSK
jgi:SAM-dependent methyltransferase